MLKIQIGTCLRPSGAQTLAFPTATVMYMAERIFPNEIFCLIVEILADDVPSLQNISLVCKELLQLSRPLIFCDIDLAERFLVPLSRVNPFLHLIRDPQSEYLRDYVQRLSINPAMFGRHSAKFNFIFQNLPSLDSLRLMSLDHAVFPIVQAHLTEKLIELRISESIFSDPEYVEPFQHLLTSFTRLRYLALDDLDMVIGHEQEIILPCTLEVLSLSYLETELLRAIALGMKTSWPPSLKSVIITYSSFTKIGRIFWEAINSNTQLVLDIDDVDPFDKPGKRKSISLSKSSYSHGPRHLQHSR
ncbi:hypothetical protein D9757_007643 [Collybiopsis confluens]|uniref:F-box domain-containing protein n=1 Tax=Collybiopsis confluens TaxID=2823264 RepID=A0A8H5M394_9AGAR|nr:hypothetical protein D9757_007643 [Collybiopsis confluens]